MTVSVDPTRKAVNVTWDESALEGDTVDLRCESPDGSDVSTRPGIENDGAAVVTFPADFHGETHVIISDDEGNTEEGTIKV